MSKNILKITYSIDNEHMSDEEFENQEDRVLIITADMIEELIREYDKNFGADDFINDFHVNKIFI